MKEQKSTSKRMRSVLASCLALCLIASVAVPVAFADTTKTIRTYDVSNDLGSITAYEYTFNASEPSTDFEAAITELKGQLTAEQNVIANKSASMTDEGAVKIDLDLVSNSVISPAVDVLFVLDQSGSMNMMADSSHIVYTSPCLNEDHYYRIPVQVTISDVGTKYFWYYVNPTELQCYAPWYSGGGFADNEMVKAIKEKFQENLKAMPEYKDKTFSNCYLNHVAGVIDYANFWNFQNEHYERKADASASTVIFEMPVTVDSDKQSTNFSTQEADIYNKIDITTDANESGDHNYISPSGNSSFCYDRMLFSRVEISNMAKTILNEFSGSRVGLVQFSGTVKGSYPLDSYGAEALPAGFTDYRGYDNTNYAAGLNGAYSLLTDNTNQPTDGRKRYVVFVTDGAAEDSESLWINEADKIKDLSNVEVYAVGIGLTDDTMNNLKKIASTASAVPEGSAETPVVHAYNCKTTTDFDTMIKTLQKRFTINTPTLTDVVGSEYELICDDHHMITASYEKSDGSTANMSFSSLEAAEAEGITYNSANNTLTWNTDKIQSNAMRVSFYQELKHSEITVGNSYNTNVSAKLEYYDENGNKVEQPLENPGAIMVTGKSVLTLEKSCTPASETTVSKGSTLKYTLKLTNTGTLDLDNIQLSDAVPAETTYVAGSGGNLSDNQERVIFSDLAVVAGGTTSVDFKCNVNLDAAGPIENIANFAITGVTASFDEQGVPACLSNEIVHYVQSGSGNTPSVPVTPTNPTNPNNPTDPSNPTNPSNPSDPSNPAEPSNPSNPSNPTNPGGSTETDNTVTQKETNTTDIVQTGDESALIIYIGSMIGTLILLGWTIRKKHIRES